MARKWFLKVPTTQYTASAYLNILLSTKAQFVALLHLLFIMFCYCEILDKYQYLE